MFKGIDVSAHNGAIDWAKVKLSGIDFAMIRVCYGWDNDNQIDKCFAQNSLGCQTAGVPFGLYHYSYAMTAEDARKEAAFFLCNIKGLKPEYPVVFDFEERNQLKLPLENQLTIIDEFLNSIESAGYYGMLYMSASPMSLLYRHAPQQIKKYDCWVAHVNAAKPAFSGNYGLWQYSWKGKIQGISGDVDLNWSYKDYPVIIKNAKLNGWENNVPPEDEPIATDIATITRNEWNKLFDQLGKK